MRQAVNETSPGADSQAVAVHSRVIMGTYDDAQPGRVLCVLSSCTRAQAQAASDMALGFEAVWLGRGDRGTKWQSGRERERRERK